MSTLTRMAAVFKELQIGGKSYKFSPLSLGDWAQIYAQAQELFFEDMRRRLRALPQDSSQFKELADKLAKLDRGQLAELAMPYTTGSEASALQVWLMLKHNHPDITKEEAGNLLTFAEFLKVSEELNVDEGGDEKSPPLAKS